MKRHTVWEILLGVTLVAALVWAVGFGPARTLAQTTTPSVTQATQTTTRSVGQATQTTTPAVAQTTQTTTPAVGQTAQTATRSVGQATQTTTPSVAQPTRTTTSSVAQPTQTSASNTSLPRTITVVGEGTVKIKPDIASVTIGVETTGTTVKAATTEASETMNDVLAALKQQGVTEQDMQTSGYSVWTERTPRPDGQLSETTTYRVNNMVTITIRKLDQVGQVMDAAIEAGANVIHGVNFALDDPKSVEADARSKAVTNALAKANELARLNQVQVGQVVSVSEVVGAGGGSYNSNFMDVQAARGMGGGGPVAPGELELVMRLQVVYAIQ